MSTPYEQLNEILAEAGVSKTIYSLVTPETEAAVDAMLGDAVSPLRAAFHGMFREAWTQKQDAMHEEFFATWKEWTDAIKSTTGRKGKDLFMPLRQALTGMDHGPELGDLLPLIGPEKAKSRLLKQAEQ